MTEHAPDPRPARPPEGPTPRRITDRHVHLLVALEVGVILLWAFWRGVMDVDLTVTTGSGAREVTLVAVVLTTTFATLAGYLALWLLRRRELRTWTITAGTAALLSCAGPFLAVTGSATVALLTFHLFVGVGLVEGVRHVEARRLQGR